MNRTRALAPDAQPAPDPRERLHEFEQTALVYTDELYATALRLTRNERDAEDLLQETFMKAYTFFYRFERNTNCRAWLFKILTNTFINSYRRKTKEREILGAPDLTDVEDQVVGRDRILACEDPERALLASGVSVDVLHALDNLPQEFRAVVILADLEDHAYKDIAHMLGCPVGTVMSRLFRGRKLMRKQLAQYALQEGIIRDPAPYMDDATNRTRLKPAA